MLLPVVQAPLPKALWSVLDGEFVRLIERASLHHVVTMVWALGKVDALTAKTWAPAERLVVSRGIEKFNQGLGFEKRAEHDEAGPMMTDLAMLMHGFGKRGLPVPELCARVASSLPRYLRELRKSKREREHVSVVNCEQTLKDDPWLPSPIPCSANSRLNSMLTFPHGW